MLCISLSRLYINISFYEISYREVWYIHTNVSDEPTVSTFRKKYSVVINVLTNVSQYSDLLCRDYNCVCVSEFLPGLRHRGAGKGLSSSILTL
jgi:hypothetical protein